MTHSLGIGGSFQLEEFIDIRAGVPRVLLAAEQNRSTNVEITLEAVEQRDTLRLHCAIEFVYRLVREIDRDYGDAILDVGGECVW
jgi:hypothetical protein